MQDALLRRRPNQTGSTTFKCRLKIFIKTHTHTQYIYIYRMKPAMIAFYCYLQDPLHLFAWGHLSVVDQSAPLRNTWTLFPLCKIAPFSPKPALRVIITHLDNNETKLTYLLIKQAERPKSNISRKTDKPIAHSLPDFFCSSRSLILSSWAANSSCAVTFSFGNKCLLVMAHNPQRPTVLPHGH